MTEAQKIYEQLWSATAASLESGGPRIDSLLRNQNGDPRRGVTLVARPDPKVQNEAGKFLREAAAVCPGQYFYRPEELHLTVLTIITGSESWRGEIRRLPAYRKTLDGALQKQPAFTIKFRGVTLSPDAVLIQGFSADLALARIRDELRSAFRQNGFTDKLDRRYKTATAHLTAMRFPVPRKNWGELLNFLQANREREFGETRFQSLQLIWSDWCASTGVVRTLQEYPLS